MEPSGSDNLDAALGRAGKLEALFHVDAAVLTRIAGATARGPMGERRPGLIEAIATLVADLSAGIRPAFRSGSPAIPGTRHVVYEVVDEKVDGAHTVRLSIASEPVSTELPAGLDVGPAALAAEYGITGRVSGVDIDPGARVRCEAVGVVAEAPVDNLGFFEVRVPLGPGVDHVRLEVRVGALLMVVPALEVGPGSGP